MKKERHEHLQSVALPSAIRTILDESTEQPVIELDVDHPLDES